MSIFRYISRLAPASILWGLLLCLPVFCAAQNTGKRLILKDGSYQVVTRYEIKGDRVRYISAERGGGWEELPKALVDWPATEKWNKEHAPGAKPAEQAGAASNQSAAQIDQEEQQERADELARMPFVAPGLRLPDESGVWVMDTFHDTPELMRIEQSNGNINEDTGHNIVRAAINPLGGAKEPVRLNGARAKVQLHVNEPVIFVSLTTDDSIVPGNALEIDTHGASAAKDKNSYSSPASRYAIVRAQVRRNLRVVGEMKISMLGKVTNSEDVVETTAQVLPGGHWLKVTPKAPLSFGEYALMELLAPGEVNLDVWDFGVDPTAPENQHALSPVGAGH